MPQNPDVLLRPFGIQRSPLGLGQLSTSIKVQLLHVAAHNLVLSERETSARFAHRGPFRNSLHWHITYSWPGQIPCLLWVRKLLFRILNAWNVTRAPTLQLDPGKIYMTVYENGSLC